jgi:tetrapyrrole methylase family protein/MazG family protein
MSHASDAIERLLAIMARLRAPDGCPWDLEQTLETLRPYVLEETYEVLEALDAGDAAAHREELGDLLLQIVFQARLREEAGLFAFADVADAISDKLVSREEKRKKGGGLSALEGVPRELPALARADRLTEKASRVGFDWPDAAGARNKVTEELEELDEAVASGQRDQIERELGDTLFALANLARKLGIAPEEALRGTVGRFIARFRHVEDELARRGVVPGTASLEEMDRLWDEAKSLEDQAKSVVPPPSGGGTGRLGKDGG